MLTKMFNDQVIRVREDDKYISLTDMAKATGKRFGNWYQTQQAKELISVFCTMTGNPADRIITEVKTGVNEGRGTWAHPDLALQFAQWCSPPFALQVSLWVRELMTTGKVELKDSIDPSTGGIKELKQQYEELEERLQHAEEQWHLWENRSYQVIDDANALLEDKEKVALHLERQLGEFQERAREGTKAAGYTHKLRQYINKIREAKSPTVRNQVIAEMLAYDSMLAMG